jgi:hypothetical protein
MFNFALASAIALFGSSDAKVVNDQLHVVQEIVRHGARAPSSDNVGFSVYGGELTPQGMRQRYLLGQLNRERYID